MLVVRLVAGIFQFQTFVADVPDVKTVIVGGERKMNAMSLLQYSISDSRKSGVFHLSLLQGAMILGLWELRACDP